MKSSTVGEPGEENSPGSSEPRVGQRPTPEARETSTVGMTSVIRHPERSTADQPTDRVSEEALREAYSSDRSEAERLPGGHRQWTTPVSTRQTELDQLAEQFPVGSKFGKYLITGMLGRGTSAVVVRAVHQTLNIAVAIKFVRPTARENNPHLYEEFKRESQLLARLNHSHVVRVWDFEDHPDHPYIVLEYVDGLNLMELVSQAGRLAPERVVQIIEESAKGLGAAWELGVIHRDVKPGNILLNRQGVAKLADLGLAAFGTDPQLHAAVGGSAKQSGELVGTAAYMPPEQSLSPGSVDHRADIYALGATFYQAVTESLPFPARNTREAMLKHVTQELTPPHELVPELPEELSDVVTTMMAKNPDDRYQSAEELLEDLAVLKEIVQPVGAFASPVAKATASVLLPATGTPAPRPILPPPPSSLDTVPAAETTPTRPRGFEREPQVEQLIAQAVESGQAGDLAGARELLNKVIDRNPLNDKARMLLAHFSDSMGEAVTHLERLLEYQPEHAKGREALRKCRLKAGKAEAEAGNSEAAREYLLPIVAEYDRDEMALLWLARVADSAEEAGKYYERVLAVNPDNRDAAAEFNFLRR